MKINLLIILKHLFKATKYSLAGLKVAWQNEIALRLEIGLLLIAIPLAFYIGKNAIECVLLICSILLLPIIELLNSAIETTINRIGMEQNKLSGMAKDLASAAIFVAIINVLIVWGIIIFWVH